MAPRHLLMTADAIGGVWHYALELARALAAHDTRTTLAVLGPAPTAAQAAEFAAVPGARLVDTGLPVDWLCDGAAPVLAAGERIAALARGIGADLVQLNMPTLAARARFDVPVIAVTHGCVATWWAAANGTRLDAGYRWQRGLMAEGLARADAVVAPSASYAAVVAAEYRLATRPIAIHNGRTPVAVHPAGAPAPHALTIGRLWDRVKGAALLDAVAARLDRPLRAVGTAAGPHGEQPDLRHLALLGALDGPALAAELARRPVFVSAASFEPFGLAVLEAAQAGCALVLSDIATFRELWDGAALFVPAHDADGYVDAIGRLFADPALRHRLGEQARQRAARYTPQASAAGMAALYDRLLGQRRVAA